MANPEAMSKQLQAYRAKTYRAKPDLRLKTVEDAIEFVEQRGVVTLWPIKDIELPSLWVAATGLRPVASEHDDPGHVTWGWKDQMLDQRRWYYTKLLRGKATFVSLAVIPNFYALSPREADLDDYRQVYRAGALSYEALRIADEILENGAMDSILLRRKAGLSNKENKSRFDRGLTELQKGLWILPVGVAEAGAWRYAFIYELVDRWFPEIPSRAGLVSRQQARRDLLAGYLDSVGMAHIGGIRKVFSWEHSVVKETLKHLESSGQAVEVERDSWATPQLLPGH